MGHARILARLTIAGGLVAGAVLGTAGPVGAKGPMAASITVEGQPPAELSWNTSGDAFYDLVEASAYWSAMELEGVDARVVDPAPSPEGLGPSVRVVWRNGAEDPDGGRGEAGLVQVIYPWATPEPVSFVAGGQTTLGDAPTTERWLRLRPHVVTALAAVGITPDGVVPVTSGAKPASSAEDGAMVKGTGDASTERAATSTADASDDDLPIGAVVGAGILVTGVAGAAVFARRRDRSVRSVQPATAA